LQAFSTRAGVARRFVGVHLGSNCPRRLRWIPKALRDRHGLRRKSATCVTSEREHGPTAAIDRTVHCVHTPQFAPLGMRPLDRAVSDCATPELLALVVGGSVGVEALDAIASDIDSGAFATAIARPDELRSKEDLSPTAAASLMAAFELARRAAATEPPDVVRGPSDVAGIAFREIGGHPRERVIVIVCDAANHPLRTVVVSDGAVDRSLMPVREILNAVLRWDGRAFAVAHNHPSGDPDPSPADVDATRRFAEAAKIVGVRFLGHVVVGSRRWAVAT
jgi:DNA repair protein RadC